VSRSVLVLVQMSWVSYVGVKGVVSIYRLAGFGVTARRRIIAFSFPRKLEDSREAC